MRDFFAARAELVPTPLRRLDRTAERLGLASVTAKDETARFGLNAFKLVGARFAIEHLLAAGRLRPGDTVICASEGNHGRAVARAARDAGCAARVYMAHDAAQARVDAIESEGATVIRVSGSYDDAVRQVQDDASAQGWTIVSDTAWDGYEEIPRLIMLGYSRIMDEVREPFDVVFVQGGVGGLLCGIASWCAMHRPHVRVVCVEPSSAACLQASARAGHAVAVTGPLTTAMAGLRNREVSPPAFAAALPIVRAFVAIDDVWAERAMRELNTYGIRAAASGSAALGGLLAVAEDPSMRDVRQALALTAATAALAIVSEGVTDPLHWRAVTGEA